MGQIFVWKLVHPSSRQVCGKPFIFNAKHTVVTLEPIARPHLAAIQWLASDPVIGRTSNVPSPYPEDGAVRWFDMVTKRIVAGTSDVFAIMHASSPVGVISLNSIDRVARRAEVDFWVGAPFQRQGIASSAVRLALEHAWRTNLRTLKSTCLASNHASSKVLEREGFVETGRIIIETEKFQGQELKLLVHTRD